jgi:hypothetical protein
LKDWQQLILLMFKQVNLALTLNGRLGDIRLSRRLGLIIEQLGNHLGLTLPRSAGSHSQTQALYRFMNNKVVNEKQIMATESARVVEQVSGCGVGQTYLAISDTTVLNYSRAKSRQSLGCLDGVGQKGFFLHSLLLTDAEGCAEGLLNQTFFNRCAESLGTSRRRANLVAGKKVPLEQKESYRWVHDLACLQTLFGSMTQHRFVHICDREGDMFELFAARRFEHIHVLTRMRYDRWVADRSVKIKEAVGSAHCGGCIALTFNDDQIRAKRTAHVEVRWTSVRLAVPPMLKRHHAEKGYEPLPMYVVEAFEPSVAGTQVVPLHWVLLTSLKIENLDQALQTIFFYTQRWRIEEFHLVLKEGCAVEKLQLETAHALKNTLATLSIVAAQVLRLRYLSQTQGEHPMQVIGLPTTAYTVVATFLKKIRRIKVQTPEQPSLNQFIQLLAILGTGNPKNTGIRAIWRGYRDFILIFETYNALNSS